ncbi:hypothetical protein Vadar_029015 [Vaccinium darrowii]|uniref:Uncharacterized protein n=1 Tax=Vaccinium darrowii TaxID=229202 RepID=A0ACB7ZH57_9ERIC|nr:hypothetical protein Vadar_029015 [Vaccinium darrowii]
MERERERVIYGLIEILPDLYGSRKRQSNEPQSSRRSRRRSLVAESSTAFFLLKNDGRGRARGDGDIDTADPAYTSRRSPATGDRANNTCADPASETWGRGSIVVGVGVGGARPTLIQIWKKGSVQQHSAAPYLGILINCGLWVLYGLPMVHPNSILVVTVNGAGVVIELVYLFLYLWYSDRRKKLRVLLIMLAECIILAVLALLVLSLGHTTKVRSAIVGSIAMFGNVLMYVSPLAVMAPNGLGILFALAQILLYAKFYRSSKIQALEMQGKGEMGLAAITISEIDPEKTTVAQNGHDSCVHGI